MPDGKILKNHQFFRTFRQNSAAVFLKDGDVLDADAEFAGDIDARLGRNDRVQRDRQIVARVAVRRLVDLQTEAVTVAVGEISAVARLGDDVARRRVNVLAGNAGLRDGQSP